MPDRITAAHDPLHPNVVEGVLVEGDHLVVMALRVEDHNLSPLDRSVKVNQDVAVRTVSPEALSGGTGILNEL